jgi:hypothetical protein
MSGTEQQQQQQTKVCIQCGKNCTKDQVTKKQWKKKQPSCRICTEFTAISAEDSRQCQKCKAVQPRIQFDIYQWGKGKKALCIGCCRGEMKDVIDAIQNGSFSKVNSLPDGTAVCAAHSLEFCDICKLDMTFPNQLARDRSALGRELTDAETRERMNDLTKDINQNICILDGKPVCPRTGRSLECTCRQVTYCSKACQVHHWPIHKITCEVRAKARAAKAAAATSPAAAAPAHGLTEEQLHFIHMEAFMMENNPGGEHSIEECAWQLGEHPLVIGGGSLRMGAGGDMFIKGDVAKIYLEAEGVRWDGSPRFGMGPYVQRKLCVDWIAKARQSNSG